MNQEKKLPLVKVIATGGTIANTPSGRLHAEEVAQVIPELKNLAADRDRGDFSSRELRHYSGPMAHHRKANQ